MIFQVNQWIIKKENEKKNVLINFLKWTNILEYLKIKSPSIFYFLFSIIIGLKTFNTSIKMPSSFYPYINLSDLIITLTFAALIIKNKIKIKEGKPKWSGNYNS